MLCLSRKFGEAIVINGNIRIAIVGNDRGRVTLGIDAPKDVPIFREELLENTPDPDTMCRVSETSPPA